MPRSGTMLGRPRVVQSGCDLRARRAPLPEAGEQGHRCVGLGSFYARKQGGIVMEIQSHFAPANTRRQRNGHAARAAAVRRYVFLVLVAVLLSALPRCASPSGTISSDLAPVNGAQYPANVAQTAATGFSSPTCNRRTTAAWRYFFVR